MERTLKCCTLASLFALVVLVLFPVRSGCQEDKYKSLTGPECCVGDADMKRSKDIDYNSFVGLMGRRSVAQSNSRRNIPTSRKRHIDHILADLLGWSTGMVCPCAEEYLQIRRG